MNEKTSIQKQKSKPKHQFQKGNKAGILFSKTNQPGNRGRKPTRLNRFLKSVQLQNDFELVSKEDIFKLLALVIFCNRAQLEKMTKNPEIPIFLAGIIKAIIVDTSTGTIETIEKILDRIYGKSFQSLEITGSAGTPLIPTEPMSRRDYERLLSELKCENQKVINNKLSVQ